MATWVAVLCLLYAGYQYWVTDLLAGRSQEQLRASVPSPVAEVSATDWDSRAPNTSAGAAGNLPGHDQLILQIPRIRLDLVVLGGVGRDELRRGPGLLPGTPAPGLPGNSVIAGHRTTWGSPFGRLDELRPGDRIHAGPARNLITYTVVPPVGGAATDGHRIVRPSDRSVAYQQTGTRQLTLVTCHPRFSAARRLVVIAQRTEPEVTTPPPTPPPPAWDVPDLGQLDFGSASSPNWPELLPPGATALLLWAMASSLGTSPRPRPRWRRVLRWIGWRTLGSAAAAAPLLVAFDRLAEVWPAG
ncbi:MAG: class E sortase [Pseudonocardiaceae bacterium]